MSPDRFKHRRPIVRPTFHHTTLSTLKLDEMIAFYESVTGLEVVHYYEGGAWLTNDEANHRIALLALPDLKKAYDKGHTVGLHHTAFEYANFDEWIDNYDRLRALGITPFMALDHGMTMSLYYQDPEGNGVEIQVDNFGEWTRSKEWMWASEAFKNNPIGVFFDPDRVSRARSEGLTFAEIHERASRGEYRPEVIPDVHLPELW